MTAIARVERHSNWMVQLAHGASLIMGLGQTAVALSSLVHKRDISTLWDIDPLAAPPRSVQQRLKGNDNDEEPLSSTSDGNNGTIDEARSVLELQLQFAMRKHDKTCQYMSNKSNTMSKKSCWRLLQKIMLYNSACTQSAST